MIWPRNFLKFSKKIRKNGVFYPLCRRLNVENWLVVKALLIIQKNFKLDGFVRKRKGWVSLHLRSLLIITII